MRQTRSVVYTKNLKKYTHTRLLAIARVHGMK